MNELINAYSVLRKKTPLENTDCGRLCSAACCQGDSETGMWLFPGEAELLNGTEGFKITKNEANYGYGTLVCSGRCDRNSRPLACRMFPLFPVIYEESGVEKIKVIKDPRAGICPLALNEAKMSRSFYNAVRLAARYLLRDEETHAYLKNMSNGLLEILELKAALGEDL